MWIAILSSLALAAVAPVLHRQLRGGGARLLCLPSIVLALHFARRLPELADGGGVESHLAWIPQLGLDLSLRLDSLGALFAVLVTGMGAIVLLFASEYLKHDPLRGRFLANILVFQAAMLGLVFADNLLLLFAFWELTSITSYLLIGHDHEDQQARQAALKSLLVTGGGGLALLAGLLLLGEAGGTYRISELVAGADAVKQHGLYPSALALILIGAFTKSAQVPFHFWLPTAMAAPTPASAYLHAATMVKAGVFLLLRLYAVLGDTDLWHGIVIPVGAATMLTGAVMSLWQTHAKKLLATTTISALGALVMLVGIGGEQAIHAALAFLVAHALYKGGLFLVAGIAIHETGEAELGRLGGLARRMPRTTAAAVLGALSMAGIPPLLGFVGKEEIFRSTLEGPTAFLWTGVAVLSSAAIVCSSFRFVREGFLGRAAVNTGAHDPAWGLWLGPLLLGLGGLVAGLLCSSIDDVALAPSVAAVMTRQPAERLALWHGADAALGMELLATVMGIGLILVHRRLLPHGSRALAAAARIGPARAYDLGFAAFQQGAKSLTRTVQSGYLRRYLAIALVAATVLVGWAFVRGGEGVSVSTKVGIRPHELGVAVLIVLGTIAAVRSRSRLGAVAALGVVGYGMALQFVMFSAPDLAMTQFVIETLTVILFALVFFHLPRFEDRTSRATRLRDLCLASAVGVLMTLLVLSTLDVQRESEASAYFVANALGSAHGRNVVNVILTDFRGLDTLGEITVLAVAGLGVSVLLRVKAEAT